MNRGIILTLIVRFILEIHCRRHSGLDISHFDLIGVGEALEPGGRRPAEDSVPGVESIQANENDHSEARDYNQHLSGGCVSYEKGDLEQDVVKGSMEKDWKREDLVPRQVGTFHISLGHTEPNDVPCQGV